MVFPSETLLARYAFSQALSRSTALSALEVSLEDHLSSMSQLPYTLAKTGKPGMNRTQLIKKLGELMKFRQLLNLNRENFIEVPDFYWAEPELEKYFKSLSNALEMRGRTSSLNDKITYAAEVQSMLRQLLTEVSSFLSPLNASLTVQRAQSSGHSMELIIIALIAVEVVIVSVLHRPCPLVVDNNLSGYHSRWPRALGDGLWQGREEGPRRKGPALKGIYTIHYKQCARPITTARPVY